ncbi:MAG: RES family NAD+ phosphorylase [Pseudomonadales bacterium]
MHLYRVCPERYLEDYSGLGASYRDGARWNEAGTPVIYFAATASVAMLELANYIPSPRLVPVSYRLGIYTLPGRVKVDTWHTAALPANWNQYPHPVSTQQLGTQWLRDKQRLALRVPSAAVPGGLEYCVMVNPLHPAITHLTLIDTQDKIYSERIFSQ